MTYIRPQRQYRGNGKQSFLLYEVIGKQATLNPGFSCRARQGTWGDTPFEEVEHVLPIETIPAELKSFKTQKRLPATTVIPQIFDMICAKIEKSWRQDKFHVVFHSSGWDSRMLSSAIKRLVEKNGVDWVGKGLLFLANRWEASEAREIVVELQGWNSKYFVAYIDGKADQHFAKQLDFKTFWKTNNPPVPICGNLWWYLPEWAQENSLLPDDDELQGYAGLFANETWRWFQQAANADLWLEKHLNWYYYTTIAMHPQKIPMMEYPLSHLDVLELVASVEDLNGDKLRQGVANYGCPEAKDITHWTYDDRNHPIADGIRKQCKKDYDNSWYGKRSTKVWNCPPTSEFSPGWCSYGLASLCEELIRRGVKVK